MSNKGRTPSPLCHQRPAAFAFTSTSTMPKKDLEKNNSVSPHRFPLLRSGSFSSRPTTPNKASRPTTPNQSRRAATPSPSINAKLRYPSEARKSASMRFTGERDENREMEPSSKSKRLLKALLSRRKSKKDEMLYTYLDEY